MTLQDAETTTELSPEAQLAKQRQDLLKQQLDNARQAGYLKGLADAREKAIAEYDRGREHGLTQARATLDLSPLFAAHAEAKKNVQKLTLNEGNKDLGYKYVSIDKFLAMAREVLSEQGLSVSTSMLSKEMLTRKNAKGGTKLVLACKFQFTVRHSSGCIDDPVVWYQEADYFGPQAFGIAHSYAMKRFYKGFLEIETGEDDDLDNEANKQGHAEPEKPEGGAAKSNTENAKAAQTKKPPAKPKGPTKADVEAAKKELNLATDLEDLNNRMAAFSDALRDNRLVIEHHGALAAKFKDEGQESPPEDDTPPEESSPDEASDAPAEEEAEAEAPDEGTGAKKGSDLADQF